MPLEVLRPVYQVGEWEVDLAKRELRSGGIPVPLGGRSFGILEVLVQSAGEIVTKDDLMASVWPGVTVEENTVQVHVSAVRKALGSDREMLKTISGRGYCLVGDWTVRPASASERVTRFELAPTPPTNLPAEGSELIGREMAVQQLQDLLSAHRAVTLTGPGGIGKTALAMRVARSLLETDGREVQLVDLTALSDPGLVPSTVASTLGLGLRSGKVSAEDVARAIGERHLLLLLDGCEHLITSAATLAEALLRASLRTAVLATSREAMRIEGEQVYRVPPLDVPSEHETEARAVSNASAVRLFVARVRGAGANFSLGLQTLRGTVGICRHLDGIPLALEFAAARVAIFGLEAVTSRLDDLFELLTAGRRTALPRHQTLRAVLDWSYKLLAESERLLLRRLAIFAGGFTLQTATAVTSDDRLTALAVFEGIASLTAKSLLQADGSEPAGGRWRALETVRAYARDKLIESGEATQTARRHAEFFRDLLAPVKLKSPSQPSIEELVRFRRELANVRAALAWSFSQSGDTGIGIILAAESAPLWMQLTLTEECRQWTGQALEKLDSAPHLSARLLMLLYLQHGLSLVFTMGLVDQARRFMERALEIAESVDDSSAQLQALWVLWAIGWHTGQIKAAKLSAERFSCIARRISDPPATLFAERLVGVAEHLAGSHCEAKRLFERVLELYVAPESQQHTLWAQYDQVVLARAMLARVLWLQGFLDQAIVQARESLEDARAKKYRFSEYEALQLAVFPIAIAAGDIDGARRAVEMIACLADSLGHTLLGARNCSRCLEGALLVKTGEFSPGLLALRGALEDSEQAGWRRDLPYLLGILAEGFAGLGQIAEALATIERALAWADYGGERWCVAELMRIKGEVLLKRNGDPSVSAAEASFLEALDVANEQGALFWELRGAVSLAQLRIRQHRADDARQILEPVFDRFAEGYETPDMRAARGLLASIT